MKKLILILGLGGSGTRIFAEIIKQLGISIGNNINKSNDNLDTALLKNIFDYDITNDPYNSNYYDSFSNTIKIQFSKSGYDKLNIFCIKNPFNIHLLHHYIKFCKLEKYELYVYHILRNYKYMINSNNKIQYNKFVNKYKYEYNNINKYIEFWYNINKEINDILICNNIKHITLYYDNMLKNIENTLIKMCSLINIS